MLGNAKPSSDNAPYDDSNNFDEEFQFRDPLGPETGHPRITV
jgi:hypothetical protein